MMEKGLVRDQKRQKRFLVMMRSRTKLMEHGIDKGLDSSCEERRSREKE